MDVRAFGSYYGQTSQLPYASGFKVSLSGTMDTIRFPACRALFLESNSNQNKGYVAFELTDAPGQIASAIELAGNQLFPLSCTAVISGNLPGLLILY
jgi:hypothetical protein